ncbi:MAG: flippase-like domain-containing protein [Thermoguttaceae bacterium]|nr:flippase-like domain-containing protein [Thermoguttaceae bacterium]
MAEIQTPSPKKKLLKRGVLLSQYLLAFLILYLIWGKLESAWEDIQSKEFTFAIDWFWLAAGGIAYAVALAFPATYWFCALRHLGQTPRYCAALRAHIVGHLGKYVPGKIFVVLIRSGLMKGPGVDTTVCVLSIFLEGLMQMAVGALVVTGVLLGWSIQTGDQNLLLGSLLLFAMVGIPILPPCFKFGVKLIGVKKFSDEVQKVDRLSWKTFLFGVPLMIGYWLLLGLSFWCVFRAIGLPAPFASAWPYALLAITASMVAGFVIVVAPGGMGVREFIIILLLAQPLAAFTQTPDAAAVVSAAVLRILWIVVELICAGVFFLAIPGPQKSEKLQKSPSLLQDPSDADTLERGETHGK